MWMHTPWPTFEAVPAPTPAAPHKLVIMGSAAVWYQV